MNKIKAAIIEDEVPAARLLHEMIQSLLPGLGGDDSARYYRRIR